MQLIQVDYENQDEFGDYAQEVIGNMPLSECERLGATSDGNSMMEALDELLDGDLDEQEFEHITGSSAFYEDTFENN
jgi:hypothetical protein